MKHDDISNERLLEIFFNAVDLLKRCQHKFDKIRVLGMMLKGLTTTCIKAQPQYA